MRNKYHTFVFNGRTILKHIKMILCIGIAAGLLFIFFKPESDLNQVPFFSENQESNVNDAMPAANVDNIEEGSFSIVPFLRNVSNFILSTDFYDKTEIINYQLPLVQTVSHGAVATYYAERSAAETDNVQTVSLPEQLPLDVLQEEQGSNEDDSQVQAPENEDGQGGQEAQEGDLKPIEEVNISPAKASNGNGAAGIFINNETKHSVDVQSMIDGLLVFNFQEKGPQVLIVHTHATEAFSEDGQTSYVVGEGDRSQDTSKNIVRVGEEMEKIFKQAGINVIHDKTLHDYPSYNGSYQNSLNTVENYKKKYPSIKIVLDVHRDGMITDDKKKLKVCSDIDGKKAAQIMFVVGTDEWGLYHPNWQENMKLAVKFQNKINKSYPTLCRPINLRRERFNQHVVPGSLIIEVGSNGNSLEEAIRGGQYAAKVMGELIKNIK